MVDRLEYDALQGACQILVPTFLIIGENDVRTLYAHRLVWRTAHRGPKEIHVIHVVPHACIAVEHLAEIAQLLLHWIV